MQLHIDREAETPTDMTAISTRSELGLARRPTIQTAATSESALMLAAVVSKKAPTTLLVQPATRMCCAHTLASEDSFRLQSVSTKTSLIE